MKAVVQAKYGDETTLSIAEVPKPEPGSNDLLIKMHTANIASGDRRINTLDVPFILKPILRLLFGWKGPRRRIRGISGSGVVESVGPNVTRYQVGDNVYFINSMKAGALAEYISIPETGILAPVPKTMSMEQAAPLAFGAMTAWHYINDTTISHNDNVLIYGASGSVGTYAVQLAKYFKANVTAVSSAKNHDILQSIGADHLIDYHTTDITTLRKQYDLVLDAVGVLEKAQVKPLLKSDATFSSVKQMTKEDITRLHAINDIVDAGGLTSVIEKVYSLSDYQAAHKHVYSLHKVGNVVIRIQE